MSVYDKLYDVDDFYFDYGIETDEPYKVEKNLRTICPKMKPMATHITFIIGQ